MSFVKLLKSDQAKAKSDQPQRLVIEAVEQIDQIDEAPKKPEEILRGNGYKIKLVTPTSFGTQIDFAKAYDPKEIEKVLNGFSIKIKGKSVFIVD